MDYYAMGQRIRRLRRQKGLTQEQLAELVELSPSFLGHIERGSRVASLETLMKLCTALEVTPNDLLGGTLSAAAGDLPERITISPNVLLDGIAEMLRNQEIMVQFP